MSLPVPPPPPRHHLPHPPPCLRSPPNLSSHFTNRCSNSPPTRSFRGALLRSHKFFSNSMRFCVFLGTKLVSIAVILAARISRMKSNRGLRVHVCSGGYGVNSRVDPPVDGSIRKRKIVEHLLLLKAKEDLLEEEEKNMLDHLYTSQYHMRGIIAISLGRVEERNADNITHVVYMRFQQKEDLAKFYVNASYLGVLREHVKPFCYGLISLDYESEVEDDILPIFRRGKEFNYGVECLLLISCSETTNVRSLEEALAAIHSLIIEFGSLIVQATQGRNFNHIDTEYHLAAVIRFPSSKDGSLLCYSVATVHVELMASD